MKKYDTIKVMSNRLSVVLSTCLELEPLGYTHDRPVRRRWFIGRWRAEMSKTKNSSRPSTAMSELTLDLALLRWSAVCRDWQDLSSGHQPHLGAFLAGWFCRAIYASVPEAMEMRDSFRTGWKEADDQIAINNQTKQP